MNAHRLWSLWQALLPSFVLGFTQRGQQRFVAWVTGLALNVEEHTLTQALIGRAWPATLTALRLLPRELPAPVGDDWRLHPPWNPHKTRPSVRDVERLLRPCREGRQRCLADWLDGEGKTGE